MKKIKRLMGQHQADQYLHYTGPRRRRRKEAEHLFEEIMVENVPDPEDKKTSRSKKLTEF